MSSSVVEKAVPSSGEMTALLISGNGKAVMRLRELTSFSLVSPVSPAQRQGRTAVRSGDQELWLVFEEIADLLKLLEIVGSHDKAIS